MRRTIDLSTDAVAVLSFMSRQRLRLYQNIGFSEVQRALNYSVDRVRRACAECVRSGFLLVSEQPGGELFYSMIATGRRRAARLVPK